MAAGSKTGGESRCSDSGRAEAMIGSVLTGRGDVKCSGTETIGSFTCGGAMGSINGEEATD